MDIAGQNLVQSLGMLHFMATSGARQTFPLSLFTQSALPLQSFEDEHSCTQNPSAQTRFPVHWLERTHLGVAFSPEEPPQP
jgi:hypothetical protein